MCRTLSVLALVGLAVTASARADGLLMPVDRSLPPLGLSYQRVNVAIDGQVATTAVEQVYRNNTSSDLEADYLFPLPAGASVRQFAMWVDGKKLTGETIEADKARKTYEDIVRRLKDPGLLEYVGCDLWKVRIYPVPRQGEQKIEIRFTTLLKRDGDMIAYEYPLRTGKTPRTTTGDFTLKVELSGPDPLGPIYSPTHEIAINRQGDRKAIASFERNRYTLDKDFALYFAPKARDVGLSLLAQRDSPGSRGYFLLLLSPRVDAEEKPVPRDLVVVLDTSSSMSAEKIRQAKGALKYAIDSLKPEDRFALFQFATVVTPFRDHLLKATSEHLAEARAWVERLDAQGATDIGAALEEAMKLRDAGESGRTFQVLFLTDGLPTVGQTDPKQILAAVRDRNRGGTRIFTFGVGDDVDAHLLDQLAESTQAASTYVRPAEDLELKASALVAKIRYPVRTELKLKVGEGVRLVEMYPPKLPDLFRGEQLQVAGRYEGDGHVALTLESRVGDRTVSESYDADFPVVATAHDFIAPIWARRKVGYLLDQIRLNGESAEVRDEVIRLAREFGIATPYTSLLVVPDERPQLARGRLNAPANIAPRRLYEQKRSIDRLARDVRESEPLSYRQEAAKPAADASAPALTPPAPSELRPGVLGDEVAARERSPFPPSPALTPPAPGAETATRFSESHEGGDQRPDRSGAEDQGATSGKAAIDLAQRLADLKKTAGGVEEAQAVRAIAGQRFRKIEDVWVDDRFDPSARVLNLQFLGAAYFRLLERHPELKEILALGDRVVWVSPSGTVLVIDTTGGDQVADAILDGLFAPAKPR